MNALDAVKAAPRVMPVEPTLLMRQTKPAKPYPLAALGPLRPAAEAIHDKTQAPPAIAAQSVLGVAALATQGLGDAELLHGQAPSSLYLLTVAQSGERKSACDKLAMEGVRAFEERLRDQYDADKLAAENAKAIWDADRRSILGSGKKKARGVERKVDLAALGDEPEAPLMPTITAGEPTFEGITRNMDRLRPALGLFTDEGGGFIGGHGMNRDNRLKTIAGFSSLWDGKPIDRWRAGDGVSVFAGRRLSAHLMVQPIAAVELIADPVVAGQGFLARFLLSDPPSVIGTRLRTDHDARSDHTLEAFASRIENLLDQALPLRAGKRNELAPPRVSLSADARGVLQAFALEVEKAQVRGGAFEAVRPFASKAAEQAARIAAVLTLYAGDGSVTGETMAQAITLAGHYLDEAVRLSDAAVISSETRDAERLRCWLDASWSEPYISASDAAQRGPFRETARNRRLFAVLEDHGWLLPLPAGAEVLGKRRREAWQIIRGGV